MKPITKRFIACAAIILLSVSMSPLANAWTFYQSGTILSGIDTSGVFGSAGTSLVGDTYSQLFTLDPNLYQNQITGAAQLTATGNLSGTANVEVTVNGVVQTFSWDLSNPSQLGSSQLLNPVTQGIGNYDEVLQQENGFMSDGTGLYSSSNSYSYVNPFNIGLNFDQVWSRSLQAGDVGNDFFSVNGSFGIANFQGTSNFVALNTPVLPVPEPETYAMLLAGLGLIGFSAKRNKRFTS